MGTVKRFFRRDEGVALILAVFYAVGVLGHAWELTHDVMLLLTPWVLLVAGIVVIVPYWGEAGTAGRLWVILTFLATYLLEVAGVVTGMVFGAYEYGTTLGFHVFGVPPIIGFNWVLVILGFLRLGQIFIERAERAMEGYPAPWGAGRYIAVAAAVIIPAVGALVFDYIMEPIAIRLEYWIWAGGDVPLQNYAAWFLIALAASAAFRLMGIRFASKIPLYYMIVQTLFFLGLYAI